MTFASGFGARPLAVSSVDERSVVETTLTDSGYLADRDERLRRPRHVSSPSPSCPIARRSSASNGPRATCCCRMRVASVEVTGSVADDIAVGALSLHYTRVSGSGEQIDFVEGELPLQIARDSEQQLAGPRGDCAAAPRPRAGRLAGLPPGRARRAHRRRRHRRRRTRTSSRSPGRGRCRSRASRCRPSRSATR